MSFKNQVNCKIWVKFGPAGEVSFAPTNYNTSESTGICELTVIRTDGSSGTGSVAFATMDDTAVAGADYLATNGVLSWADGETNKTISVEIINRHGVVGTRTFNVVLNNAIGVTLGDVTTTTVTIVVNPPDVPTNVTASKAISTNAVEVSWDAVADVTSYEVWRNATDDNTATAEKISGAGLADTSYADTNAEESVTYYYWVKAVNGAGASDFSASDYGYRGVIGPLVYINGKVGLVPTAEGESLTLAVEMMNIGPYVGVPVDWWVVGYVREANAWYYLNGAMQWTPFSGNLAECRPVYQGGLMNTGVVLLFENFTLPAGTYDVWLAVDYPMDGTLTLNGPILFNHAVILVE